MFSSNDPGYNPSSPKWSLPRTSCESNSNLDMHYAKTSGFDSETIGLYEDNTPAANFLESTWPWNVLGSSGPIAPLRGPLASDILSAPSAGSFLSQSNLSAASTGPLHSNVLPADDSSFNTSELRTDPQFADIHNNSTSSFTSSFGQSSTQESETQSSNVSPSPVSTFEESPGIFKCPMGDATFTEEKKCRRHWKEHQKPYMCERCPKAFRFKRDLKRHQKIHNIYHKDGNQIRPGDYTMCPYTGCKYHLQGFSRRDNYLRHVRNQHP
ncbi:hypothetical protein BS50DRAFT_569056 [Corynespora cassiicola Philippines]|uniref:C2H2-type domain-containing protein n=1 Tax=Corynespora cassiicola Philippines TaxID=1448308 RepID=A0A2T2P772_CORCC|nr:hypothetical protein BS50DRAFT_569056 [Corynespora cassiicola Philippines]